MNLIELQPDDVLVLRTPGRMSQGERKTLADGMAILGAGREVLIIDGGYTLDVVRIAVSGKVETNDIVRLADGDARLEREHARVQRRAAQHADGTTYVDSQFRPITKEQNDALIAARDAALGQREVQHVDTDEPEAEGIPPHVYLYRNMLTDLQALAPLGRDETNGQYAVAIDQLTDEQRAIPHVVKQLPLPNMFDLLQNPGA